MKDIVKTQVRIPRILRDWVREKAKNSNRSMNGELVELIKTAKEQQEAKTCP